MSSANTLTGRNGVFKVDTGLVTPVAVARATQWAVNPTLASTNEWGDSDSGGYTNRSAGRKDATFTAEGKYDTTTEIYDTFESGDVAAAQLNLNAGTYWDFPRALCNDFNMTINIDTEEVIGWTSGWGADGTFTKPSFV